MTRSEADVVQPGRAVVYHHRTYVIRAVRESQDLRGHPAPFFDLTPLGSPTVLVEGISHRHCRLLPEGTP